MKIFQIVYGSQLFIFGSEKGASCRALVERDSSGRAQVHLSEAEVVLLKRAADSFSQSFNGLKLLRVSSKYLFDRRERMELCENCH